MIALDTSVLARYILNDTVAEAYIATQIISENECVLSWSVLVELCWVLESSADLPKADIADIFYTLAQSKTIILPDAAAVNWVIDRYAAGADFADMVHLISTVEGVAEFATFDRKLVHQAGQEAPLPIRTLRA